VPFANSELDGLFSTGISLCDNSGPKSGVAMRISNALIPVGAILAAMGTAFGAILELCKLSDRLFSAIYAVFLPSFGVGVLMVLLGAVVDARQRLVVQAMLRGYLSLAIGAVLFAVYAAFGNPHSWFIFFVILALVAFLTGGIYLLGYRRQPRF
jgi:hypothetical protein